MTNILGVQLYTVGVKKANIEKEVKMRERDLERKSTVSGEIFGFSPSSWRSFSSYNQLSFGVFEPLS